MTGIIISASTFPAYAATTDYDPISKEEIGDAGTTRETEVLYTQASNYSVIIPKTIVLDGQTKASDYTVKVSGDISSDKQVLVAPQDTLADIDGVNFYMVDQASTGTKKADVQADVTQNATVWTSAEVCALEGTTKDGNVAAPTITAGSWKGTFTFNITLEDTQ